MALSRDLLRVIVVSLYTKRDVFMSSTFRAALSIIALNLSLIVPAFAQSNFVASTTLRAANAEEESLRELTASYGRALETGDLDAIYCVLSLICDT